MNFCGSLVIQSRGQVQDFLIPSIGDYAHTRGSHTESRYVGGWTEAKDCPTKELYVPHRYKHTVVSATSEPALAALSQGLEALDSQYVEARYLYKLNRLINDLSHLSPWAGVANVSPPGSPDRPGSGAFYLFGSGIPLHLYLVWDLKNHNTRLLWSTEDLKYEIRQTEPLRYAFYQMPCIVNRSVFLPTQYICSRWWSLVKSKEQLDPYHLIRAANALEVSLFKDPTIERHGS